MKSLRLRNLPILHSNTLRLHHYNTTTLKIHKFRKSLTNQQQPTPTTHNVDTRDPTGFKNTFLSTTPAGGYYWNPDAWPPSSTHHDEILEFNEEEGSWRNVGTLSMKRHYHAISAINFLAIKDYCA